MTRKSCSESRRKRTEETFSKYATTLRAMGAAGGSPTRVISRFHQRTAWPCQLHGEGAEASRPTTDPLERAIRVAKALEREPSVAVEDGDGNARQEGDRTAISRQNLVRRRSDRATVSHQATHRQCGTLHPVRSGTEDSVWLLDSLSRQKRPSIRKKRRHEFIKQEL